MQAQPTDVRQQRLTLAAASISLILVMLNVSMINPILPALRADLGGGALGQQWAVNAYNLVFASALLLGGLLGDRYGHRRVLLGGLTISIGGALAAAAAPTIGTMLAFRAVQGFGAALVQPATLAVITYTFVDPRARAKALGLWGAVSGLGIAIGPVAGGVLVDSLGWRIVFLAMVPVGLLAMLISAIGVRETPSRADQRVDWAGLTLIALALAALSLGLSEGQRLGFDALQTLVLLGGAVGLFAAFLLVEVRVAAPIVDLRAFRNPAFTIANMGGLLAFFATFPLLVFTGIYLQQERGLGATQAGLLILLFPVAFATASPIGARILARFGPRLPVVVGMLISAIGAGSLIRISIDIVPSALWWSIILLGTGVGLSMSSLTSVAVGSVGLERTGMAASLLGAMRQIGTTLGIAVLGTVISLSTFATAAGLSTSVGLQRAAVIAATALLLVAVGAYRWIGGLRQPAVQVERVVGSAGTD